MRRGHHYQMDTRSTLETDLLFASHFLVALTWTPGDAAHWASEKQVPHDDVGYRDSALYQGAFQKKLRGSLNLSENLRAIWSHVQAASVNFRALVQEY